MVAFQALAVSALRVLGGARTFRRERPGGEEVLPAGGWAGRSYRLEGLVRLWWEFDVDRIAGTHRAVDQDDTHDPLR